MNELELALYKTHKSLLELHADPDIQCILDTEITLGQCSSCGIWLKPSQFKKDLDDLDICSDCYNYYGP